MMLKSVLQQNSYFYIFMATSSCIERFLNNDKVRLAIRQVALTGHHFLNKSNLGQTIFIAKETDL